jgi:hypothetical protein
MLLEQFLMLLGGIFAGGACGLPLSTPPLPADPVIERSAPDTCLMHVSLRGVALPAADGRNLTERMLADQEVQDFVGSLVRQLVPLAEGAAAASDPAARPLVGSMEEILATVLVQPCSLTVERIEPEADGGPTCIDATLVVKVDDLARDEFAAAVTRLMEKVLLQEAPPTVRIVQERIAGGTWSQLSGADKNKVSWGFQDDYFVLTIGDRTLEATLGRLADARRAQPAWRAELERRMPVTRQCTLAYVDTQEVWRLLKRLEPADASPSIGAVLDASGLAGLRLFGGITGMTEEGVSAAWWLGAPGAESGVFQAAAGGVGREQLAKIPADVVMAHAWKLDLSRTLTAAIEQTRLVDPAAAASAREALEQVRAVAGIDIDRDLLRAVGDDWRIFAFPGSILPVPDIAIEVGVRDRTTLAKTHSVLLRAVRDAAASSDGGFPVVIKEVDYRGQTLFCLESTPQQPIPVTPTWCLTDDELLITLSPQLMKTLLSRKRDDRSLADVPAVAKAVDGNPPALVSYIDTAPLVRSLCGAYELAAPMAEGTLGQQGIRLKLPQLPAASSIMPYVKPGVSVIQRPGREGSDGILVRSTGTLPLGPLASANSLVGGSPASTGVLVALLLPAVQAAREAAQRANASNNYRSIMLAMLNYETANRRLPAPAIVDKAGKPLLSWRVAILPFLEQQELYQQFHLDEPWDSKHNKQLLARMPEVYGDPSLPPVVAGAGLTTAQLPMGKGTAFRDLATSPKMDAITDGTSNTAAVIEVSRDRAVPWTKPVDHEFDATKPLDGLGHATRPGQMFFISFFDGSVHTFDPSIDPDVIRAVMTPDGGEAVGDR